MKRLSFSIILILLIIAASDMPQAKVTGVCSDCHTMHNSQGGASMATGYGAGAGPYNTLLRANGCLGCHADATAGGAIWQGIGDAPVVFNTSEPTYGDNGLAGGNFHYLISDGQGDASGHNVVGIKILDETLGKTPPGGTELSSQLTCAGEFGCHGDRSAENDELAGIKGAHHTDDDTVGITGDSVGLSYRFLDGILGTEDDDWEQDNINTSHNEYKGGSSFPTSGTISSLCGQCHGDFHSSDGVGTASPWLRHPTDAVLKVGTPDTEYEAYTRYNMTAPVARPDLSDVPTPGVNDVRPGTDIIMCLSCHRAHGSPNYKMIRWNNKANMSGCVVCHTSKS